MKGELMRNENFANSKNKKTNMAIRISGIVNL